MSNPDLNQIQRFFLIKLPLTLTDLGKLIWPPDIIIKKNTPHHKYLDFFFPFSFKRTVNFNDDRILLKKQKEKNPKTNPM